MLAYTARGFGKSGGLIHLDAPDYEVADAQKLVSYLATLPAGASRTGRAIRGSASPARPTAVGWRCCSPAPTSGSTRSAADITWNYLSHALFPNAAGAHDPGVFKKLWAGYLFQSGSAAHVRSG